MPFTDEESAAWLAAKRAGREQEFIVGVDTAADFETEIYDDDEIGEPVSSCLHCGCSVHRQNALFGEDVAICDICNGD